MTLCLKSPAVVANQIRMKEHLKNPFDDGWNPDDFAMDSGSDDASDIDLWQIESSPDDFGSEEYAPIGIDEPDPEEEFAGDLSRELHVPDDGIRNLPQALKLDEFLAYVGEMTDCQRYRIEETLLSFSAQRRANWLRWMQSKEWTGKSLLLFMQFHDLWNNTPMWWECVYFSASFGVWESHYNSAALTREKCYDLVFLRSDHRLEKIIDAAWLEDWDYLDLSRYGFNSFASFAVFRANVRPGEDWERLVIDARDEYRNHRWREWQIYLEWWSEMSEWRDNLI